MKTIRSIVPGLFVLALAVACANSVPTQQAPIVTIPGTAVSAVTPTTVPLPSATRTLQASTITPTVVPATQTASPILKPQVLLQLDGAPNKFSLPTDVALDAEGNLYVIDSGNHRIQKFDRNGKFLLLWGNQGTGEGQFNFIDKEHEGFGGIEIAPNGRVYVADSENARIQVFDTNGKFLQQWGKRGKGNGEFVRPIDLAIDRAGNVFVIDDRNDQIQKFDGQGKFLLRWGGNGSADGQLKDTGGIAVDTDGNVYVADFGNNRVQKFDNAGKFLAKWGSRGRSEGKFVDPDYVHVDDKGNVYVVEYEGARIQKFDGDGTFRAVLSNGLGLSKPIGLTVDAQGIFWVADYGHGRVLAFRLN